MTGSDAGVDIAIEFGSRDAEGAADAHRGELALVDQAAHAAGADREASCGLFEGQ